MSATVDVKCGSRQATVPASESVRNAFRAVASTTPDEIIITKVYDGTADITHDSVSKHRNKTVDVHYKGKPGSGGIAYTLDIQ